MLLASAALLHATTSYQKEKSKCTSNNNNGRFCAFSCTDDSISPSCFTASIVLNCTKTAVGIVATTPGELDISFTGMVLTNRTINNTSGKLAIPDIANQDQPEFRNKFR